MKTMLDIFVAICLCVGLYVVIGVVLFLALRTLVFARDFAKSLWKSAGRAFAIPGKLRSNCDQNATNLR